MPWITPSVFKQSDNETVVDFPYVHSKNREIRFFNILHLYNDKIDQQNNIVQNFTCWTIDNASKYYKDNCNNSKFAVTFVDDPVAVPFNFTLCALLTRSVLDVGVFENQRKLPLLFDVINIGYEIYKQYNLGDCRPDDYIVFTNSDIHFMPFFYNIASTIIQSGFESLIINRRTISSLDLNNSGMKMLAFAEFGVSHPGYDCFIFPAIFVEQFISNNACLGTGWVMRSLLYNLVALSEKLFMATNIHATFHVGDSRPWDNPKYRDYLQYNLLEASKILTTLKGNQFYDEKVARFCVAHNEPSYDSF